MKIFNIPHLYDTEWRCRTRVGTQQVINSFTAGMIAGHLPILFSLQRLQVARVVIENAALPSSVCIAMAAMVARM